MNRRKFVKALAGLLGLLMKPLKTNRLRLVAYEQRLPLWLKDSVVGIRGFARDDGVVTLSSVDFLSMHEYAWPEGISVEGYGVFDQCVADMGLAARRTLERYVLGVMGDDGLIHIGDGL